VVPTSVLSPKTHSPEKGLLLAFCLPEKQREAELSGARLTERDRDCTLAVMLADRLRTARLDIADRWVQRIGARATRDRPPPTVEIIERMPGLIDGIAWYFEHPDDRISTEMAVVRKAMELCTLRHAQGFDAQDILADYMLLGRELFDFLSTTVENVEVPCDRSEALVCGYRLFHAMTIIEITTTTHFIRISHEQVAEREGRLQAFNRAVSHEIKNRIGTVINAGELLSSVDAMSREQREHFAGIITRNAQEMRVTVDNLLVLARLEDDPHEQRHVPLRAVAGAIARQVHAMADSSQIALHVDQLPDVEINAAVHLCLANYVTNAIKFSDPEAPQRFVRVEATIERTDAGRPELVVRVRDNGIGVPADKRAALFQRFFRVHQKARAEGTGLGLSIVRETMKAIGGRAWAEFPDKGSIFALAVPFRPLRAPAPSRPRPERRQKRKAAA
jgi:signal transduction histidine kinase